MERRKKSPEAPSQILKGAGKGGMLAVLPVAQSNYAGLCLTLNPTLRSAAQF